MAHEHERTGLEANIHGDRTAGLAFRAGGGQPQGSMQLPPGADTAAWVLSVVPDAAVGLAVDGTLTAFNPAAERLFGYAAADILGQSLLTALVPQRHHRQVEDALARTLLTDPSPAEPRRLEGVIRRANGTEVPVEITLAVHPGGGATRWLAFVRDVTDRVATTTRLAAQLAVTQVLADAGSLETAAPRLLQVVGAALGRTAGVFWRMDGDALRVLATWSADGQARPVYDAAIDTASYREGEGLVGQAWARGGLVTSDDLPRASDPRFAAMEAAGFHHACAFPAVGPTGIVGVLELVGWSLCLHGSAYTRLFGALGSQIGQFAERKRAEAALLQRNEEFRQAQKLEAVGRLAGGVAHDFSNLLTVIRCYASLLRSTKATTDDWEGHLDEVIRAADQAGHLTRQLLAFSRKQVARAESVDLGVVVQGLEKMLHRLVGEDIAITTRIAPGLGAVMADASHLEQVIMNLVVNARDAMPHGGSLVLDVADVTLDRPLTHRHGRIEAGRYVRLAVTDSGHGIPDDVLGRIFEPFFTTKGVGQGTGLGLSTVLGIVEEADGHVTVETMPGRATTFGIYLPHYTPAADQAAEVDALALVQGGHETILVAEDKDAVRYLACTILRGLGYTVLEASDGEEACAVALAHPGPIHLLLTDVVMPKRSGRAVAEVLQAARPALRVCFMSGYTDDEVLRRGVALGTTPFLQKPFTPEALGHEVRQVLDAASIVPAAGAEPGDDAARAVA